MRVHRLYEYTTKEYHSAVPKCSPHYSTLQYLLVALHVQLLLAGHLRDVHIFPGPALNVQDGAHAAQHADVALDLQQPVVDLLTQLALLLTTVVIYVL